MIVLLWLAFAASHMGLASQPVRGAVVARLGERGYLGLFSLVAFAVSVPLVWTYGSNGHTGPLLWAVPAAGGLRHMLYLGNALGFALMGAALLTPSPLMVGGHARVPRGVQLICRHALFMGLALWALMHLVVNGFATDVAFFGGFVVFAVIGCWHQDRRKLATGGEAYRAFYEATPFFPFTGRETLRGLREISRVGVILGLGAAVVLRVFHDRLFS